jgi:hypothetical protein
VVAVVGLTPREPYTYDLGADDKRLGYSWRVLEVANVLDRAGILNEMIGEYEYELSVTRSRLDEQKLRRAKYELAREVLVEHGELEEAERLRGQIRDIERHIDTNRELAEKLEGLIATYRRALEKVRAA